jgi:hypothetical protein
MYRCWNSVETFGADITVKDCGQKKNYDAEYCAVYLIPVQIAITSFNYAICSFGLPVEGMACLT